MRAGLGRWIGFAVDVSSMITLGGDGEIRFCKEVWPGPPDGRLAVAGFDFRQNGSAEGSQ